MSSELRPVVGVSRRLGPWWVVAVIAAAGLVIAAVGQIRAGGYVLAAACAVGGVLRGTRSRERAGGLAVRRRWVDVVSWLGLGVAVAVAFALVRL